MMTLDEIYSSNIQCQYKTNLEGNTKFENKYKKIANKWKKKLFPNTFNNHSFTIRVCSSNWNFDAHFDCIDNTIVILDGSKTFLIFDIFRHNLEMKILDDMKSKSLEESKKVLNKYGIKWACIKVNKNETFRIKERIYHKVESIVPNILLNIKQSSNDDICVDHFDNVFKKQAENCKNNYCLD